MYTISITKMFGRLCLILNIYARLTCKLPHFWDCHPLAMCKYFAGKYNNITIF